MMNKENRKQSSWLKKPYEERKVKYISMRVTQGDHERIMALFGDNRGVREFLIKYAKDHEGEKL
jgi:hypothetical protein